MKLGVNVDHVATLRQARLPRRMTGPLSEVYPDPVLAAAICQKAGAHSVVMHLREDRRHIQDKDVFRAKKELSIKFNLEMSIAPQIVEFALRLRPDQATFVPERRLEQTTEGGLDLFRKETALRRIIERFRRNKILVSLFIDPEWKQIDRAKEFSADAVEFHTGDYANAKNQKEKEREFQRLLKGVTRALELGITAHAGHGLDYHNVRQLKQIRGIEELNIGYAIVTRALWVGWEQAVKEMLELIR